MTDQPRDVKLEAHIKEFLDALNERLVRDRIIRERTAAIEQPTQQNLEDFQRYLNEYKTVYAENLAGLYDRIGAHGLAIRKLTDETEIRGRVEKMMRLAEVEGADVVKTLKSIENTTNTTNVLTITALVVRVLAAGSRGLPRQKQLDDLTLDLSVYCLQVCRHPNDSAA